MKISKALFDDPRAARNVAETMHEAPRESKAWIGWLLAGLIVGGMVTDVWHMYEERLARDDRYRMTGAKPDDNSPAMVPEGKAPSSVKVTR